MTEISNVDVTQLYVENNHICYDGVNKFKTTIDKTNYVNKIKFSLDHPENNIVVIIFNNLDDSVAKLIDFINSTVIFNEIRIRETEYIYMFVDPNKIKIYINGVELSIPPTNSIVNFITQHVNNNEVEYTFKLLRNRYVTTYTYECFVPYINEIRIKNNSLSTDDINRINEDTDNQPHEVLTVNVFEPEPARHINTEHGYYHERLIMDMQLHMTTSNDVLTNYLFARMVANQNASNLPYEFMHDFVPKNPITQNHLDKIIFNSNDEYYCSLCQETIGGGKRYVWKCCNKNICHDCGLRSIGKQESTCAFCRRPCD